MKYFILLGTFFFCTSLTAGSIKTTYTDEEVLQIAKEAYRMGWDRGVNHKVIGCSIRSM